MSTKQQLIKALQNRIDVDTADLYIFRTKLDRALPHQFAERLVWANSVFEVAGRIEVFHEALESLIPTTQATLTSMRDYALRQVIAMARHQGRSTSTTANLMDDARQAAWATLFAILDGRDLNLGKLEEW